MSNGGSTKNGMIPRISLVVIGCLVSALLGANLMSEQGIAIEDGRRLERLEAEDNASREDRRLLDMRITSMETFLRLMDTQNTIAHRDILLAIKDIHDQR